MPERKVSASSRPASAAAISFGPEGSLQNESRESAVGIDEERRGQEEETAIN
jgi:hypothetical protein